MDENIASANSPILVAEVKKRKLPYIIIGVIVLSIAVYFLIFSGPKISLEILEQKGGYKVGDTITFEVKVKNHSLISYDPPNNLNRSELCLVQGNPDGNSSLSKKSKGTVLMDVDEYSDGSIKPFDYAQLIKSRVLNGINVSGLKTVQVKNGENIFYAVVYGKKTNEVKILVNDPTNILPIAEANNILEVAEDNITNTEIEKIIQKHGGKAIIIERNGIFAYFSHATAEEMKTKSSEFKKEGFRVYETTSNNNGEEDICSQLF